MATSLLLHTALTLGLNVNDLIDLLNRGLTVGELLDVIGRVAREQHGREVMA
jgi:hypothetical protein